MHLRKLHAGIVLAACFAGFVSAQSAERAALEDTDGRASCRLVAVSGPREFARIRKSLGREGMLLLKKINRRDERHLRKKGPLIVPDKVDDVLAYSPFPQDLTEAAEVGKLILVSLRLQAFAAYEKGRQVRWGPVSSGIESQPTPATLYHVNWKSRRRVSSLNPNWIMPWYSNLHLSMGVGFHQYSMPGLPASHGCIRLLREDARWIYEWSDPAAFDAAGEISRHGTPTIVFGRYDYQAEPPWLKPQDDCRPATVSALEIDEAVRRYLWAILQRSRPRPEQDGLSRGSGLGTSRANPQKNS